jgi:hypothetical protein
MFGQAMATSSRRCCGHVIFMRGYNPARSSSRSGAAVSVLVSVPKILDVLKEHVVRASSASGRAPKSTFAALVALPESTGPSAEVLGVFLRCGAARYQLEDFWGELGSRHPSYGSLKPAPIVTLNHPFRHQRGLGRARRSPASR